MMEKIKNKNKKLGQSVKKLEFKILKVNSIYHLVVSRKRSGNNSRLDKVGFFQYQLPKSKYRLLALDFEKIRNFILKGTSFHRSVFKFLI